MRKYIILFLILIFLIPIVLFFIKQSSVTQNVDILKNNTSNSSSKEVKNFLNPKDMLFPEGFTFEKAMNAKEDIGKSAFYYDYNPVSLDGTEWVTTKKVNSASEYADLIMNFNKFYSEKFYKNGWVIEQTVDTHNLQPLAADNPLGNIYGYHKYENGNVQVILFYNQKDSSAFPANVQFRIFLSNTYSLNQIIK